MSEEIVKEETQELYPKNPWLSSIPILLSVFIFVLDGTIANVALPHMAGSFSATRDESIWILTSYLIASGIVIPTVDWFSKLLGRKNFYVISVLLFTVASLFCGMANSLGAMIAARIVQGFGGGGIVPLSQAIMLESFPKDKRAQAMAAFGMGVIIAPILGPVIGGWITDNWTWPWIYFINVPFGCIAAIMCHKFLWDPPYARRQKGVKIDALGFFLLVVWIAALQIVLDKGNNSDWFHSTWVCWTFTISCLAGIGFFVSQLVRKNTLIDLSVFKDVNFLAGTAIQIVVQGVLFASIAILPQFLQSMMGYTAFLSGQSMMPRGCGSMLAMFVVGNISNKVNNKLLVMIGLSMIGASGLAFGFLNLNIANVNIMIPNFFMGMGMGITMIPLINLSVDTLKNEQMTNASGVQNLLKTIGGAIGTSFVATFLSRFAQAHQFMMVGKMHLLNPVFAERVQALTGSLSQYTSADMANYMAQYSLYGSLIKQATLWAFMDAFRIFGLACFIIIPLLLLIKANRANE